MVTFPMSDEIPPEQIVPNILVVEDNIFEGFEDLFPVETFILDITYNGTTTTQLQFGSILIPADESMLVISNYWTCVYSIENLLALNTL